MANPTFLGGDLGVGHTKALRYANPFYGVPAQLLPQDMDHMLQWANHFLVRFTFYRAAISRVANYFITSLKVECEDAGAKKKYEEIFEELEWKTVLYKAGMELIAYGNVFMSVNQGFDRFLSCPECHKVTSIEKLFDYQFTKEGKFVWKCPSCQYNGPHEVHDKPSKDLKRVNVVFWNPREIEIRYEDTTNQAEYHWEIPQQYATKVMHKNNKFFSKRTPKAVYDAILQKKMLSFNKKNFIHQKIATPSGLPQEGKAVPLCIYMWDEFFMLKILERYNQAICFEDIVPFRVFSLSNDNNPNNNSILNQNGAQWRSSVQEMVDAHRIDPGGYHMFPYPLAYQQLGGDGKNLVTPELIQQSMANLLNSLNIPQELYTMTLQAQAVGPALRLFENSWTHLVAVYNNLLTHWAEVVGKIAGLPKAKISLLPITLADDMERKSVIAQLVSSNAIARSELLEMYDLSYEDQVRKKMEEDAKTEEIQKEYQTKKQLEEMAEAGQMGSGQQNPSPQDVLSQAQEIAQQLYPMDGAQRRQELQKIKAQDATLHSAVKQALEDMTSGAKSQGVQSTKQQAAQQGGQQQ